MSLDLGDSLVAVEQPYKYNLTLEVTLHNRVRFELPREDKGQGIATALAMMIAEEMDADYDRVDVELSDRRSDRTTTITGGSSTIRTMWEPARTVAANARLRLVTAAATRWGVLPTEITVKKSLVIARGLRARARTSASSRRKPPRSRSRSTPLPLKPLADYTIIGTPRGRKNARAIVTGAQKYTLDLGAGDAPIPGQREARRRAAPARHQGPRASRSTASRGAGDAGHRRSRADRSRCRIAGRSRPLADVPAVDRRRGGGATPSTDALRRARRARPITWAPGPMATTPTPTSAAALVSLTLPLTPVLPGSLESLDATFDFPYVAHAPLEVMNAVADVRRNSGDDLVPVADAELSGGTDRDCARHSRRRTSRCTSRSRAARSAGTCSASPRSRRR